MLAAYGGHVSMFSWPLGGYLLMSAGKLCMSAGFFHPVIFIFRWLLVNTTVALNKLVQTSGKLFICDTANTPAFAGKTHDKMMVKTHDFHWQISNSFVGKTPLFEPGQELRLAQGQTFPGVQVQLDGIGKIWLRALGNTERTIGSEDGREIQSAAFDMFHTAPV